MAEARFRSPPLQTVTRAEPLAKIGRSQWVIEKRALFVRARHHLPARTPKVYPRVILVRMWSAVFVQVNGSQRVL